MNAQIQSKMFATRKLLVEILKEVLSVLATLVILEMVQPVRVSDKQNLSAPMLIFSSCFLNTQKSSVNSVIAQYA